MQRAFNSKNMCNVVDCEFVILGRLVSSKWVRIDIITHWIYLWSCHFTIHIAFHVRRTPFILEYNNTYYVIVMHGNDFVSRKWNAKSKNTTDTEDMIYWHSQNRKELKKIGRGCIKYIFTPNLVVRRHIFGTKNSAHHQSIHPLISAASLPNWG